jgi:hypothetical protein
MWWKNIVSGILSFFASDAVKKIQKCIPIIVASVEKAMQDGKITAAERKEIAIDAINALATQFGITLNGIQKWILGVAIDRISAALPSKDIDVASIQAAVKKAIGG